MEKLATKFGRASVGTKLDSIIQNTIPSVSFPIISRGESWVRVNDIVIDEHNDSYRVKRKGITLAFFQKRSWAVAYAVSYCQREYTNCSRLVRLDFKLTKYIEEIARYNYQLEQAREQGKIMRENVISDRLSRTITDYEMVVQEAEPIIKTPSLA